MKYEDTYLPQVFYLEHLQIINGVKFTRREIDIISFIISGRSTKKIASFFSLSPRTIDNYIRNIMLKLECNSRERIIDFIEKSRMMNLVRQHYSYVLLQVAFETCLKDIAKRVSKNTSDVFLVLGEVKDFRVSQLEADLRLSGVTFFETPEKVGNLKNVILIFLDEESEESSKLWTENNSIKMNFKGYYDSFFSILKCVFSDIKIDDIIVEFKRKCEAPAPYSLGVSNPNQTSQTPISHFKDSNKVRIGLCITLFLLIIGPLYVRHNFERDQLLKERGDLISSWVNSYETHFNQAITHAKFYEWRGNALNIPLARKISKESFFLKDDIYSDIESLHNRKVIFANSLLVLSPFNWNLSKEISALLEKQDRDLHIAASFNNASQMMSQDNFGEVIKELDSHAIKDITRELERINHNDVRKKVLHSYLAIALNMKNGVARKRLLDTKEVDKQQYIKSFEDIIKEMSWSGTKLDNSNYYTFLNLHRLNSECALREEDSNKKQQFEAAARLALGRSIELAQHETAVLSESAYHYKYTKENDRALLAYDSALKFEPNHSGLLYGRAELCLRMGEEKENPELFKTALSDIKKANDLKPNDCDMIHLLVWASIHADSCDKANHALYKIYKPLCAVNNEEWDDMSGLRDDDVKWLEEKLNVKCKQLS